MDLTKMKETQKELKSGGGSKEFAISKEIKGNGVNNIFRIADSDNYAICKRSWIVCDDGVVRPFTLVDRHGNKSPLLKLLGDPDTFYRGGILEGVKDEITKKSVYKFRDTYPDLILRLGYNGDRSGQKGNAKLQKQVVYNIYDRDLYEGKDEAGNDIKFHWCDANKHTMLLWIKQTAFDTLITTAEGNGDPIEYDCTYTKVGSSTSTTHIIQRAGDKLPGVKIGFITEEEKAYAQYDLDVEAGLSPAGLILHFLSKLIGDLDIILGYNVLDELKEVAAIERNNQSAEEGSTEYEYEEEEESVSATSPSQPVQQPQVATPTPAAAPVQAAAPVRGAAIRGAAKPAVEMIKCQHEGCGKDVPADATVCPHCKNMLQAPCDACGKDFSVFSMTCPHCGHSYKQD